MYFTEQSIAAQHGIFTVKMAPGWNFEVNVQGTSLRAVVSSVPSVELPIPVMQSLLFSSGALHTYRQGQRGCLLERKEPVGGGVGARERATGGG